MRSGDAPNAPPPHAPAERPARPAVRGLRAATHRGTGPKPGTPRYRSAPGPGRWDPRSAAGQARARGAPSARSPRIPTADPDPRVRDPAPHDRSPPSPSAAPVPEKPTQRGAATHLVPRGAARAPGVVAPAAARPRQSCRRSARVWCRGRGSAPGSRRLAPAPRPEPPFLPSPASSRGARPAGDRAAARTAQVRGRGVAGSRRRAAPPAARPQRRGRARPGRVILGSRGRRCRGAEKDQRVRQAPNAHSPGRGGGLISKLGKKWVPDQDQTAFLHQHLMQGLSAPLPGCFQRRRRGTRTITSCC